MSVDAPTPSLTPAPTSSLTPAPTPSLTPASTPSLTPAQRRARAAADRLRKNYVDAVEAAWADLPKVLADLIGDHVPCDGVYATLDSKILQGYHVDGLIEYISTSAHMPYYKSFNLVYRASDDGFASYTLREACKQVQPMLLVLKSKNGIAFGGFMNCHWYPGLKKDRAAFLFAENANAEKAADSVLIFPVLSSMCRAIGRSCGGPAFGPNDLAIPFGKHMHCLVRPPRCKWEEDHFGEWCFADGLQERLGDAVDRRGRVRLAEVEVFECR